MQWRLHNFSMNNRTSHHMWPNMQNIPLWVVLHNRTKDTRKAPTAHSCLHLFYKRLLLWFQYNTVVFHFSKRETLSLFQLLIYYASSSEAGWHPPVISINTYISICLFGRTQLGFSSTLLFIPAKCAQKWVNPIYFLISLHAKKLFYALKIFLTIL